MYQLQFVSEILKIISIGQFGYFGYNALEKGNYDLLALSAIVFLYLIIVAVIVLEKVEGVQ